jgi:hypothetical protein
MTILSGVEPDCTSILAVGLAGGHAQRGRGMCRMPPQTGRSARPPHQRGIGCGTSPDPMPRRDSLPGTGGQLCRQGHRHVAVQRSSSQSMRFASLRWTTRAPISCSASLRPPTTAGPWPSPHSGHSRTGPVPTRAHHRGVLLDCLLHHATTVVTGGESYRMREARTTPGGPKKKS